MKKTEPQYLIGFIQKYDENSIIFDTPKGGHVLLQEGDARVNELQNSEIYSMIRVRVELLVDLAYREEKKCWLSSKITRAMLE